MTAFFTDPAEPGVLMEHIHDHVWVEIGAKRNPNGTWSSIWGCELCPDIGVGGKVGPVPHGYCWSCGWVQQRWPRKKCEECKQSLQSAPTG